ncbi:unnamed protein product [Staurois parvus]|uniref:Uncharacterized protein n=1 Tax=Staurois parvus TaxID=386267 RepID=A0ABN9FZC9_9NEOB|nr:unnamed protein product [Staurois parvus]
MYTQTHVRTYTQTHTHMYIHTHTDTCTDTHMYIYTDTLTCIHKHTHMYKHACTQTPPPHKKLQYFIVYSQSRVLHSRGRQRAQHTLLPLLSMRSAIEQFDGSQYQ